MKEKVVINSMQRRGYSPSGVQLTIVFTVPNFLPNDTTSPRQLTNGKVIGYTEHKDLPKMASSF